MEEISNWLEKTLPRITISRVGERRESFSPNALNDAVKIYDRIKSIAKKGNNEKNERIRRHTNLKMRSRNSGANITDNNVIETTKPEMTRIKVITSPPTSTEFLYASDTR